MILLKEIRDILGAEYPFKIDIFENSIGFSIYEVETYICLNKQGHIYLDIENSEGKAFINEVKEIALIMGVIEKYKKSLLKILL